ncbi:TetR/AcrR family transcriptional regulator [Candidatus Mycobacterium wuenschmannii]|uniref:TetR/AcrR family transcriptional regulator n=1 Tax=Candidatus Mycobacterium wuenschmannii TaxID=3027808 RepID=A0ABY8VT15_9MYCO|nr:TetR/AcrR family transcriptional regulator [Candidatus Mycobacterium wuenschmannii]WIM86763.1 TetR/AcrR family transcriptional regulator [Candidatus Mycobacterium wuenschmannii]
MGARSSPGAGSADKSLSDDLRERLIDAALELFVRQGYDATSADQIAARADASPADFAKHFDDAEAVLVCIVDAMSHATAAELQRTSKGVDPESALLSAGSAMVTAIVEGRGAVPLERLIALARIVSATRNLHRKVSAARRRVIAPALADWMGVSVDNRRLQRALTMWSAVTASAYVTAADLPDKYQPQRDSNLQQRMISNIAQSFSEVMGDHPRKPE